MNIIQIYKRFPTQNDCIEYLEKVKWQGTPQCPYCKSDNSTPMPKEKRYHCNNCNTSYSVTVGTIFHKTHLDLQKWFLGISLILNAKKGISARQLARDLEVNKNTGWYMAMRIRKAMFEDRDLLQGIVEMDETFIGGKPRRGTGETHKRGRGTKKVPVVGMVERDGNIKAVMVYKGGLTSKRLSSLVREKIDTEKSTIITDEFKGYLGLAKFSKHEVVNHQTWYVDGYKHTNNIESFWSLLKRGIIGQYHKVSVKHLPKYINEFCYRHNYRKHNDLFGLTLQRALGVIK